MKKRDLAVILADYEQLIKKNGCPFVVSDYENIFPNRGAVDLFDVIDCALKYGYVVGIRQERYKRARLAKKCP